MLRHLFSVTARSSSRSLIMPRGYLNALSRRTFYPKSDRAITCKKDSWSSEWPTMYQQASSMQDLGNRNLAIVNRAPTMPNKNANCNNGNAEEGETAQIEKVIREVSKVGAAIGICIYLYRYWHWEQQANRKLCEDKKVILNKTVFSYDKAAMMHKATFVQHIRLHIVDIAESREFRQICDSLKWHGITVDRSHSERGHYVFSYRLQCYTEYEVITRDKNMKKILEEAIIKMEEMETAHAHSTNQAVLH